MKRVKFLALFFLLSPSLIFGAGSEKDKNRPKPQANLAAGCAAASKLIFLEFNNVRTRVEAGGLWWQDRANTQPDYEVPKGSNSYSIYAGGLWLAGTDVNGQLKAAVSQFGRGVDYWTGPLDTTGSAEINDAVCAEFDRFFEISRAEVVLHNAFHVAKRRGDDVDEKFPNYQTPTSISEWPANGNRDIGQAYRLAPYKNIDGVA